MLPGIAGGIIGAAGAASIDASYLSRTTSTSITDNYSFGSYGIGAAATDRRVFIIVHWLDGIAHNTLDSVSIGGVSATIHLQDGHSGGATGFGIAIVSAIVPSGTTATVEVNFSGVGTAGGCTISGIRITGLANSSPHDTAFDENTGTAGNLSSTIDVPSNGVLIAGYTSSTNASGNAVSWTGATEEYDTSANGLRVSLAWADELAEQTGRTIAVSTATEGDAGNAFVAVSWN